MYYNGKLLCRYINILLCRYYKYTPRKWGKGKTVNDKKHWQNGNSFLSMIVLNVNWSCQKWALKIYLICV